MVLVSPHGQMGHVRQGTRGRRDREHRTDRQCGWAGRKRQVRRIIGEELDVAEVDGERRASTEVGPERGERQVEDRVEEAGVAAGWPLGVDVGQKLREIIPAAR